MNRGNIEHLESGKLHLGVVADCCSAIEVAGVNLVWKLDSPGPQSAVGCRMPEEWVCCLLSAYWRNRKFRHDVALSH